MVKKLSSVVRQENDLSTRSASAQTVPLSNGQLFRWMLRFLKPVKGYAFIGCLLVIGFVTIEVLLVNQVGRAIDEIQLVRNVQAGGNHGFWSWLMHPTTDLLPLRNTNLVLIGLVLGLGLLRYLREINGTSLTMEMLFYLRQAVYDKLQRVGFSFHDRISSGQLINRALSDLGYVRLFAQNALLTTLEISLTVGGYIILLLFKSWWVALLALAPLPIWTFYILRFSRKIQPLQRATMEAEDRNVSIITENIAGVHVVKAFATQELEIRKYNRNADLFLARILKRIRMFANFTPVVQGISNASHLTLFLAVGILVIRGTLQPGDFLVLAAAMGSILAKLQQVSALNEQYQAAIVSARRLHEVLHAPPSVPERDDAVDLPVGGGAVRFDHVTFGYDPNVPVLKDISFSVAPGSTVAIIGPTGAGKSTLVGLIARFYDPQQGSISIDNVDLRDLKLASLRTSVAYTFQEIYLFSDTVANNISYGRPQIKGGEVEAAARLAQAHEFIMELPRKYDTILGERGASLSGGQRQRLAIARAILANPRILVLDDATAAVDPETDDLIRRGMRFVMYGRTTFTIAHRISTVKSADLVLVLEHGKISQMGTHDQLIQRPGHYRDIAVAQLQGGRADTESPSHMDRMTHGAIPAKPAPAPELAGQGQTVHSPTDAPNLDPRGHH